MGKTAREIINVGLIADLTRAYADEWLAYYLYDFLAQSVSGDLYPQLKDMLEETAKAEYEHANELADMIVKLGGKLIGDPTDLGKKANFPAIVPPDMIDFEAVVTILAESEANAIKVYNELALKTKDMDIPVYQLVAHILSEEISHEESFENLVR